MASIYDLKPGFQNLLRPVTRFLAAHGVTANQITLAALGLSCVTGAVIALVAEPCWLLLLPGVLFIRMALNAIDGMLAREHGMKTALGALLNELGDVISDAALFLPLTVIAGIDAPAVVILVMLAMLTEMTGVCAVQIGAQRRYDGPMGKSDRAFLLGAVGLLLGCGVSPGGWLTVILIIADGLLVVTVFNRARHALNEVSP